MRARAMARWLLSLPGRGIQRRGILLVGDERVAQVSNLCALFLVFALAGAASARDDTPAPQGRISDFAHVIGNVDRARIEQAMLEVERRTGAQIGVATVRSLKGVPIEDFAVRAFQKWGVGRKGRDNGVLVVLAVEEGAVRIEVGYGLEGALPDALCSEINRKVMIPRFKQGDFAGGLADGVERIAQIIAEKEPAGARSPRLSDYATPSLALAGVAALAVLAVALGVRALVLRRRSGG